MYFKEASQPIAFTSEIKGSFKLMLIITALLVIILGVYPELLIGWIYH